MQLWDKLLLSPCVLTFYPLDLRFPWREALVAGASFQSIFIYGGHLIFFKSNDCRRHVLTAAHCIKDPKTGFDLTKDLSLLTAVLGLHKKGSVGKLVAWISEFLEFQAIWERSAITDCQSPLANRVFLGYALEENDQWCCSVGTKNGRPAFPKGEDQGKCKFSQFPGVAYLPSFCNKGEIWGKRLPRRGLSFFRHYSLLSF